MSEIDKKLDLILADNINKIRNNFDYLKKIKFLVYDSNSFNDQPTCVCMVNFTQFKDKFEQIKKEGWESSITQSVQEGKYGDCLLLINEIPAQIIELLYQIEIQQIFPKIEIIYGMFNEPYLVLNGKYVKLPIDN